MVHQICNGMKESDLLTGSRDFSENFEKTTKGRKSFAINLSIREYIHAFSNEKEPAVAGWCNTLPLY